MDFVKPTLGSVARMSRRAGDMEVDLRDGVEPSLTVTGSLANLVVGSLAGAVPTTELHAPGHALKDYAGSDGTVRTLTTDLDAGKSVVKVFPHRTA